MLAHIESKGGSDFELYTPAPVLAMLVAGTIRNVPLIVRYKLKDKPRYAYCIERDWRTIDSKERTLLIALADTVGVNRVRFYRHATASLHSFRSYQFRFNKRSPAS